MHAVMHLIAKAVDSFFFHVIFYVILHFKIYIIIPNLFSCQKTIPRPKPSFKTKTETKTLGIKTKTKTLVFKIKTKTKTFKRRSRDQDASLENSMSVIMSFFPISISSPQKPRHLLHHMLSKNFGPCFSQTITDLYWWRVLEEVEHLPASRMRNSRR